MTDHEESTNQPSLSQEMTQQTHIFHEMAEHTTPMQRFIIALSLVSMLAVSAGVLAGYFLF